MMKSVFVLQQQEYELVMDEQINFVLAETVAGNRGKGEVCLSVCLFVSVIMCFQVRNEPSEEERRKMDLVDVRVE